MTTPTTPAPPLPAVRVEDLTRLFPPVTALDRVSLQVAAGEIHAVVGENGAGKSTLVKILAGILRPTSGRVSLFGNPARLANPADAARSGVAMIHQELNLVDELSAADNIFLGRELARFGLVNRRQTLHEARTLLADLRADIDPATPVKYLSIAQKQLVEIAKALSQNARIIIMDEPTAVLSAPEAAALFALIRRLKSQGVTVIYISHLLPEVIQLADRVTVMRDGRVVSTLDAAPLRDDPAGPSKLAALMVGREMLDHFPHRAGPGKAVVLEVQHLSLPGLLHDITFSARRAEVFGFAGLIGAGRTELGETLVGLRRKSAGRVLIDGSQVRISNPADALRHHIAYLSEDRRDLGLTMGMSIAENITLVSLRNYAAPFINRRLEDTATLNHARALSIKLSSPRAPIDTLSGGNQQKVALAKWLETNPRVLILDEPTRGIDIGAKEEIYRLIHRLAQRGLACIVISSELNELLGLCHRIAVMRQGRIAAILDAQDASEQSLMALAAGVPEEATS